MRNKQIYFQVFCSISKTKENFEARDHRLAKWSSLDKTILLGFITVSCKVKSDSQIFVLLIDQLHTFVFLIKNR